MTPTRARTAVIPGPCSSRLPGAVPAPRRSLLGVLLPRAAIVLFAAVLSACTSGDERAAPALTTSAAATGTSCRVPPVGPVDPASVLVPGPTNRLPRSDAGGERLVIVATVLDPGCEPASQASVTAWHTDARGDYGPRGTDSCCYYLGSVTSDTNGRLRLESIRPAQYPQPNAPPAHIHLEIRHSSGQLDTEIVFTGEQNQPAAVLPAELISVPLRRTGPGAGDAWYGEVTFVVTA